MNQPRVVTPRNVWQARHAEKRAMIAKLRASGMPVQKIADVMGVSRQRIDQALKREGVK
jgi:IS30 family transposase